MYFDDFRGLLPLHTFWKFLPKSFLDCDPLIVSCRQICVGAKRDCVLRCQDSSTPFPWLFQTERDVIKYSQTMWHDNCIENVCMLKKLEQSFREILWSHSNATVRQLWWCHWSNYRTFWRHCVCIDLKLFWKFVKLASSVLFLLLVSF